MPDKHIKSLVVSVLCVMMFLLAACSDSTPSETGQVPKTTSPTNTPVPTTAATANATVINVAGPGTAAATNVTPPAGPKVVNTPTPIAGGNSQSQQLVLKDRTLLITDVTKQTGSDPTVVSISLTLTVKDTGGTAIKNQPEFFQLVGAEGDTFGKQSNSSDTFYGPIDASGQRSGTIVFQVPSAALNGIRLMYRPEDPSETIFTPLSFK